MEVSGQLHSPAYLPPGEITHRTHWIRGWVGPKTGLDAVEKREILHCRVLNPGRPARTYPDYHVFSVNVHVNRVNSLTGPEDGTHVPKHVVLNSKF
jgi:hypothetical protein